MIAPKFALPILAFAICLNSFADDAEMVTVRSYFKSERAFVQHVAGVYPGLELVESRTVDGFYVALFHVGSSSAWLFADSPQKWDWRFGPRPSYSLQILDAGSKSAVKMSANVPSELRDAVDGWCIGVGAKLAVQYSWPEGTVFELPNPPTVFQLEWRGISAPWIIPTAKLGLGSSAHNITQSTVIRKGISVIGMPTDVEIKKVSPAIRLGLDRPVSQVRELAQIPELDAFARINHPQDLSVEVAKSLTCRAGRAGINEKSLRLLIADTQAHPERHRMWVRNLVFITQGDLKVMYVCFNFEEAPPGGPMVLSPFVLEGGVWKSWTKDLAKSREFENAFHLSESSDEKRFFRDEL